MSEQISSHSILIILPDLIGTTVCSLPAVEQIFENFPASKIHIFCRNDILPLLTDEFFCASLIPFCDTLLESELSEYFEQNTVTMVFDFLSSKATAGVIQKANAAVRIGFDFYGTHFYNYPVIAAEEQNVVYDYLHFLSTIGYAPEYRVPRLQCSNASKAAAVEWCRQHSIDSAKNMFMLGIGGGNTKKRWGVENYAALGRALTKKYGGKQVFITGPKEASLLNDFDCASQNCVIADSLPLDLLKGILSLGTLTICNDYAVMHISGALGVPTIGIFLSSLPEEWFVYEWPSGFITGSPLSCRPCYSEACAEWTCNEPALFERCMSMAESLMKLVVERDL